MARPAASALETRRVRPVPLVLCCSMLLAPAAHAQPRNAGDLPARARSVETCFITRLADLRAAGRLPATPDAPRARVYAFEQIQRHLREPGGGQGRFWSMEPAGFCEELVIKPYVDTVTEIVKRNAQSADLLAPAGTTPIESDSWFIEITQNVTGRHVKGHSDITAAALDRAAEALPFIGTARELIVRASQEPDLYRWKQERYHAHTPGYAAGDAADRRAKMAAGIREFRGLLRSLRAEFERSVRDRRLDRALFLLGVAAHSVQDLVYHRGITLQQHAGLAYALHPSRNPDLPKGALEQRRWNEAVGYTVQLIEAAMRVADDDARNGLLKWTPGDRFRFRELARAVFRGDEEDISVSELILYWELSWAYQSGERPLNELEQGDSCDNAQGLACWRPDEVLVNTILD